MEISLDTKIRAIEKQLEACGKQVRKLSEETERDPRAHEALAAVLEQRRLLEQSVLRLKAQQ